MRLLLLPRVLKKKGGSFMLCVSVIFKFVVYGDFYIVIWEMPDSFSVLSCLLNFTWVVKKNFLSTNLCLQTSIQTVGYLSLTAHLSSLYLTQPIFLMPKSGVASGTSLPLAFWPRFSPLQTELPCQLHLLNLRTMQNKDDSPDLRFIPKDSAALLFHHFGSDCDFPIYTNTCQPNEGQVTKQMSLFSVIRKSPVFIYFSDMNFIFLFIFYDKCIKSLESV